jgi:hypothetical protein
LATWTRPLQRLVMAEYGRTGEPSPGQVAEQWPVRTATLRFPAKA